MEPSDHDWMSLFMEYSEPGGTLEPYRKTITSQTVNQILTEHKYIYNSLISSLVTVSMNYEREIPYMESVLSEVEKVVYNSRKASQKGFLETAQYNPPSSFSELKKYTDDQNQVYYASGVFSSAREMRQDIDNPDTVYFLAKVLQLYSPGLYTGQLGFFQQVAEDYAEAILAKALSNEFFKGCWDLSNPPD